MNFRSYRSLWVRGWAACTPTSYAWAGQVHQGPTTEALIWRYADLPYPSGPVLREEWPWS